MLNWLPYCSTYKQFLNLLPSVSFNQSLNRYFIMYHIHNLSLSLSLSLPFYLYLSFPNSLSLSENSLSSLFCLFLCMIALKVHLSMYRSICIFVSLFLLKFISVESSIIVYVSIHIFMLDSVYFCLCSSYNLVIITIL